MSGSDKGFCAYSGCTAIITRMYSGSMCNTHHHQLRIIRMNRCPSCRPILSPKTGPDEYCKWHELYLSGRKK